MSEHFTQHRLSPETIPHDARALSHARALLSAQTDAQLAQPIEEAARAPRVASAWALALLEQRRWDLLVAVCIRSLEHDQQHVGLMLLLSLGLSGLDETTEALVVLERVFELIEHEGHYYQLSVELAEAFHHRLEGGSVPLTELPTFNMSTPEELTDLTDTSLSISMVREWLEAPGSELSLGEPDLDGPTQNLSQGDLKRLMSDAGLEVVEFEQDSVAQEAPQWPEQPALKPAESAPGAGRAPEGLESEVEIASISELESVSELSSFGSSSWELSIDEQELVSRAGDRADPDTLSVSDSGALVSAQAMTSVLEGPAMTSVLEGPAMTSVSSDSAMTSVSSDSAMTSVSSDSAMTSVVDESVSTRAIDQGLLDLERDSKQRQEDSVITSAVEVVTPPRVPPPPTPPTAPPNVVLRSPSLKPSAQRPPPLFNPELRTEVRPKQAEPSRSPSSAATPPPPPSPPPSSGSFNLSPSTRALPEEPDALKSKVSTRALPSEPPPRSAQGTARNGMRSGAPLAGSSTSAQREDRAHSVKGGASTRSTPERSRSFEGSSSTRALLDEGPATKPSRPQSTRNLSTPSSLEPKPLEQLREPEPLSHMEGVSPRPPAHVGAMTTSAFEETEGELSVAYGQRSASSPWVTLGTTLLILLSSLVLVIGFGFQLQKRRLQEGLSLSTYVSDDGVRRLNETLTLQLNQPLDWPLFVTQLVSEQLGLSSEPGRRLNGLRAWARVVSWVGYGRDERQEQAARDLLLALQVAPVDPFTLSALSLYLCALSAQEGAIEVAQMIPYQSWLRGLSLGVIHERGGALGQAFKALQESDALNPSATLTHQLSLSILDRYQSAETSLEFQRRQARYGVDALDLSWAAPEVDLGAFERSAAELPSPVELSWALSALMRAQPREALRPVQQRLVSESGLLETPSSRQLISALRYARMRLAKDLLSRAPQLIEERYLQGQLTLTERNLAHFEFALSQGDINRAKQDQIAGSYEPHPRLVGLIPTLLTLYPSLKQGAFAQQVNVDHHQLINLEVERQLLARSWASLRLLIRDPRAKQLSRATYSRLETLTRSLTVEGVKALSKALRDQDMKAGHDPHSASYPNELLMSYAMSESGQAERAARYALSFSRHDGLSAAAQLNANIFICRALDQVALLPSQWLSCKGAYERAPYRYDTSEGYALLLEELGELEEVAELLSPMLKEEQRGALSPALDRLAFRLALRESASRPESNAILERYQGAIQLLGDGLYMSGTAALAQLPDPTRLERFERAALIARLTQDVAGLRGLSTHGSLAAQLQLWALSLSAEGNRPSQLALNAVIGSPQVARMTELVDLMTCFAREGRLDLHHMNLAGTARVPLKASPPPKRCRASYHSLLKGSFKPSDLPPFAQHLAGLLYLSVGELSNAEQLWRGLLSDPLRSLEARLALGLLQLRQGRTGLVQDSWKPLLQERSELSALLKQTLRR